MCRRRRSTSVAAARSTACSPSRSTTCTRTVASRARRSGPSPSGGAGPSVTSRSPVDNYVTVKDAVVGDPAAATIGVNGRFSIGSHAVDDELRGTFKVSKWPLKDFRDAFGLTNWPVEGVGSADLDLHGPYRHPDGHRHAAHRQQQRLAGAVRRRHEGTLTFEGTGLFMGGLQEMRKGAGRMRGRGAHQLPDNVYARSTRRAITSPSEGRCRISRSRRRRSRGSWTSACAAPGRSTCRPTPSRATSRTCSRPTKASAT